MKDVKCACHVSNVKCAEKLTMILATTLNANVLVKIILYF